MDEAYDEARKRMDTKNNEHTKKLKTPAMYALDVYVQAFTMEGLSRDSYKEDSLRIRFKFLDYACIEVKASGSREAFPDETTNGSSSPPSSPSTPTKSSRSGGEQTGPSEITDSGGEMPQSEDSTKQSPNEGETQSEADTADDAVETKAKGKRKNKSKRKGGKWEKEVQGDSKGDLPVELGAGVNSSDEAQSADSKHHSPRDATFSPSSTSIESSDDWVTRRLKKKKDPRYFDPRKLLKSKPLSAGKYDGDDLEEDEYFEAGGQRPAGTGTKEPKSDDETSNRPSDYTHDIPDQSTESGETTLTMDLTRASERTPGMPYDESLSMGESMQQEDYSISEEDHSSAFHFGNGKSLIFCKKPLELLHSLPRFPLIVIFFRPPAEVLGLCRIDLSSLTDAVDKSIVLTKSTPLSGVIRDSFDIMQGERKIGTADVDVRLCCFGPFLLHEIFVKDNPNDTTSRMTEKTSSNHQIVTEMSAAKLRLVRNKSKMFASKSQTTLVGKVMRDVSLLPPIICADEHILEPSSKPKPETSVVEQDIQARERAREDPQYKCVDWEVVFTRNVIKDLIAKNRRPFQYGSSDRKYVESYFPELMPKKQSADHRGGAAGKRKCQTKTKDKCQSSLYYLPLAKDWVKENNIERIRKKSARPTVRTSFSNSSPVTFNKSTLSSPSGFALPSTASLAKLPTHNVKSMSHVAINHYDVQRGEFEEDSRILVQPTYSTNSGSEAAGDRICPGNDSQNGSRVAMFHYNPNKKCQPKSLQSGEGSLKRAGIFNTRHPRVDSSLEKYNPIPEKPFTLEITAPERSLADKLVQAIRVFGKEVEALGGDTKLLYNNFSDLDQEAPWQAPTHIQERFQRTTNSPEVSTFGIHDVETVTIEVDKGVPLAVPARSSPYWEGHAPVCSAPTSCPHYLILHPGFGYYGR